MNFSTLPLGRFFCVLVFACVAGASAAVRADGADQLQLLPEAAGTPAAKAKSASTASSKSAERSPWRFFGGVGYDMASDTKFSSASLTSGGNTTSGWADFSSQPAFEILAGVQYSRKRAIGYYGELTYQTARQVSSMTLEFGGEQLPYSGPEPVAQAAFATAGVLYRFDQLYFPIGLNCIVSGSLSNANGDGYQSQVGPGVGGEGGVGYDVTRHFSLEAEWKTIAMTVQMTGALNTINLGTGFTSGFAIEGFYVW